ncbi:MAG: hypothetical protein QM775_36555 [Pirellulales bacterium]
MTGIAGVVGLTAAFASLPGLGRRYAWDAESWNVALAAWNSCLVVWIATLAAPCARQNPRRDWTGLLPVAGGMAALAWLWPLAWDLGLVYLHPLVALWFVDRELGRRNTAWRCAYRFALPLVPLCLGLLWWRLADLPDLPGDDALSVRITRHAGEGIVSGLSTRFLVAAHVFLEMLHYGVWILAIPLIASLRAPWRLERIPLAQRGVGWKRAVAATLTLGLLVTLLLWAGFLIDYPWTRDVYFTVAMLHVLAEVPFLLRLL